MKVNYITPLSFYGLGIKNNKGVKIPEDFICRSSDPEYTMHNISIFETEKGNPNHYKIFFTNDYIGQTAKEFFSIHPERNHLFIDRMDSEMESFGLGTCMHLTNIIEMLENNIDTIKLNSAPSAIPFHTKFGYYPVGDWEHELFLNVNRIKYNDIPELQDYSKQADFIISGNCSYQAKKLLGNKILNNYTIAASKILSKPEQQGLFIHSVHMELTKDKVLKNKDFYNNLFKKYCIDYQID